MSRAFLLSSVAQPHPGRAKAILAAHPEVRGLFGRNPWTALVLTLVLIGQFAVASGLGWAGLDYWWLALIVAYGVGAFASHSFYAVVHEATHNLIFRSRLLNRLCILACDLVNVVPGGVGFAIYHLPHHAYLGETKRDADIASAWEARLVGNRWYLKAAWLLFFPFFQVARLSRVNASKIIDRWLLANCAVTLAADVAIATLLGWNALIYLFASMFFALGLHPLGARWIQEHYTNNPHQETSSYYGPLNRLALNLGFHTEHHDFPAIPWNRLPRLKAIAPEFYDSRASYPSWAGLLFEFIFDPRYSLHSRVVRTSPSQPLAA